MQPEISAADLNTWADFILNHSMGGVQPDDVIMIKGEHMTWPLMSVLQDKIFAAGAIADINLVAPDNDRGRVWGGSIARFGTTDQIERVPAWHRQRYEAMTKYIEVLGSESPALFANLPEKTAQALMRADEPFKNIRLAKPWVLTLYPTQAFADLEGMSLAEYTDIIVSASTTDPRMLEERQQSIYQLLKTGRKVTVETWCPVRQHTLTLTLDITDRLPVSCIGERNFPDGEVYTSPNAPSVEGEIFVDLPVFYAGTTIQGIYLRFEKGIIREYHAEAGGDALKGIIETDEGSHRLGEIALGMNSGIRTALKHPLFVEKVGGTLHIAIGASYPDCYVEDPSAPDASEAIDRFTREGLFNHSAQHVDIVVDFRPGGAGRSVSIDDVPLKVEDNLWVPDRH